MPAGSSRTRGSRFHIHTLCHSREVVKMCPNSSISLGLDRGLCIGENSPLNLLTLPLSIHSVYRVVRQVEKERPVLVLFDELAGLGRKPVGQVFAGRAVHRG